MPCGFKSRPRHQILSISQGLRSRRPFLLALRKPGCLPVLPKRLSWNLPASPPARESPGRAASGRWVWPCVLRGHLVDRSLVFAWRCRLPARVRHPPGGRPIWMAAGVLEQVAGRASCVPSVRKCVTISLRLEKFPKNLRACSSHGSKEFCHKSFSFLASRQMRIWSRGKKGVRILMPEEKRRNPHCSLHKEQTYAF